MMVGIVAFFVLLAIYVLGYKNGEAAGEAKANGKYKDKIVVKTKEVVDDD